jgi:hypothetical protein
MSAPRKRTPRSLAFTVPGISGKVGKIRAHLENAAGALSTGGARTEKSAASRARR